ncbi:MAG: hypothetical protein HYU66_22750, partial [Armatimonadetes bacterium]|nr:hypothetical protein [Armatimonadota bacterium]
ALVRTTYHTRAGDLERVAEPVGFTTWTHEHLFKSADDYDACVAVAEAEVYEPNYDAFEERRRYWDGDAYCRATIGYTPLNQIIYGFMDPLCFALEWEDHRDQVLRLHGALAERRRALLPIVAASPAQAVNVCGNLSPQVIGRERFEQYILPQFQETCAVLHRGGKLVGSHLDDNCRLWADLIAVSGLDYVEAFTPSPDCDMTVAQAREAWPDKALWINFPSSMHLASKEIIAETTRRLLADAGDGRGFLIGITEDVPPDRWAESFQAILGECRAAGARPGKE